MYCGCCVFIPQIVFFPYSSLCCVIFAYIASIILYEWLDFLVTQTLDQGFCRGKDKITIREHSIPHNQTAKRHYRDVFCMYCTWYILYYSPASRHPPVQELFPSNFPLLLCITIPFFLNLYIQYIWYERVYIVVGWTSSILLVGTSIRIVMKQPMTYFQPRRAFLKGTRFVLFVWPPPPPPPCQQEGLTLW